VPEFPERVVPEFPEPARVGLVIAAVGYLVVFGLALAGKTLYPRWASVALPVTYVVVAFGLKRHVSGWADLVLGAGGWNLAGALLFAMSTAVLWNRPGRGSPSGLVP
jgi:hypothetical protein